LVIFTFVLYRDSNFKLQTSNFKHSNECSAFAIRGWVRTVFNSLQLGC